MPKSYMWGQAAKNEVLRPPPPTRVLSETCVSIVRVPLMVQYIYICIFKTLWPRVYESHILRKLQVYEDRGVPVSQVSFVSAIA